MFNWIKHWWSKPPAKQRVLNALSTTEWRPGLDVSKRAEVSTARFYPLILDMEETGLVLSKWDEGPLPPARHGYRRRLYRKISD